MPTKREREYYRMGFIDGSKYERQQYKPILPVDSPYRDAPSREYAITEMAMDKKFKYTGKKRKLSAWNKYVKANSKKPRFRYRNGKLNLKKMAVAFRKTRKRGGKR